MLADTREAYKYSLSMFQIIPNKAKELGFYLCLFVHLFTHIEVSILDDAMGEKRIRDTVVITDSSRIKLAHCDSSGKALSLPSWNFTSKQCLVARGGYEK